MGCDDEERTDSSQALDGVGSDVSNGFLLGGTARPNASGGLGAGVAANSPRASAHLFHLS